MELYAIEDTVAQEYMPPFVAQNDLTALRVFGNTMSADAYAKEHVDEFKLWCLGSWNRDTGDIYGYDDVSRHEVKPNIDKEEALSRTNLHGGRPE